MSEQVESTVRSCVTCLRGPIKSVMHGTYCSVCGDELEHFVPITFDDWKDGEERIDQIAQNGNEGLHYEEVVNPLATQESDIRIYPVKVIGVDETDDVLFTLEAFDEFSTSIEIKTILSNSNVKEVLAAIETAVYSMKLEG